MSKTFADALKEIFPPITEETRGSLRALLLQHQKDHNPHIIFATSLTKVFSQGDIVTNIPFLTLQEDSEYLAQKMYGMILSNTCDFANNENVLLAPAYEMNFFIECFGDKEDTLVSLRNNLIYDKFCLPAYSDKCPELVIDFNGINSFAVKFIEKNVAENRSGRVASLSQEGYYYLLTKLTVHFLRPESTEVFREELL